MSSNAEPLPIAMKMDNITSRVEVKEPLRQCIIDKPDSAEICCVALDSDFHVIFGNYQSYGRPCMISKGYLFSILADLPCSKALNNVFEKRKYTWCRLIQD